MKITPDGPALPALTFFGDSSSHDKEYMVAGGFAVAGNRIREVEDHIAALRDDCGIRSEFHWASYRGGQRQEGYEELVKYGFSLVNLRHAAFHVIVARFQGYNHKAKEGEDRQTSVNRMYYQLALHRLARFYGKRRAIHLRLDSGNDSKDICAMRNELCADAYKKLQALPNCVKSIEPIDSKNSGIVQLSDVIVGAIAAKQNKVQHSSPKAGLADFVLRASGRHSWAEGTPMNAKFLTVWHFTPKRA